MLPSQTYCILWLHFCCKREIILFLRFMTNYEADSSQSTQTTIIDNLALAYMVLLFAKAGLQPIIILNYLCIASVLACGCITKGNWDFYMQVLYRWFYCDNLFNTNSVICITRYIIYLVFSWVDIHLTQEKEDS